MRTSSLIAKGTLATLLLALSFAPRAAAQQPAGGTAAPPAAVGQDNSALGTPENPPLSGMDQPSLEPGVSARNFLQPAIQVNQAVDSNIGNDLGESAVHGVTRVLGSLLLKRLWSRYETDLAYVGGGALYTGYARTGNVVQALEAQQRLGWRTGQLILRDMFSYLPEGQFGAAGAWGLNNVGGQSLGSGISGIFNSGQLGSLGQEPRITNIALADMAQSFTPRTALTLTAGYGLVHFTDNSAIATQNNPSFIDSNTVSVQAAYNYQLSRRDQVALLYAYQNYTFPDLPATLTDLTGASVRSNIVSFLYGHRISGRMNFAVGAGPLLTHIQGPQLGSSDRFTAYGHLLLQYRFTRTVLSLAYNRHNTNGSGFFLGAESDIARLSAARPLSRRWEGTVDVGYSHSKSLISGTAIAGLNASGFDRLFAGADIRRQFGRYWTGYLNYQFNNLMLDGATCGGACSSQRHVALLGVEWHPRPIRLD